MCVKSNSCAQKFVVKDSVANIMDVDNICVEVTLLTNGGNEMNNYTRALFSPGPVYKWCTSSKNSLIAHQF